jgi:hypothetical protein
VINTSEYEDIRTRLEELSKKTPESLKAPQLRLIEPW